jgi:hexosaminidase
MFIRKLFISAVMLVALGGCKGAGVPEELPGITQVQLNILAEKMDVKYRLIENRGSENCVVAGGKSACHIAQLIFTSPVDVNATGWHIYLGLRGDPIVEVRNNEFTIEQINGDFHRLSPTDEFTGFSSGKSKIIEFVGSGLVQSESVLLPNYYIVAEGLDPSIIASTKVTINPETGMEVRPYVVPLTDSETQFNGNPEDQTLWATSSRLYQANQNLSEDVAGIDGAIIPTPTSVTKYPGQVSLANGISLRFNNADKTSVQPALDRLALLGVLEREGGLPVTITVDENGAIPAESYQLEVARVGITINAVDSAGALYGIQSLASLVVPGETDIPLLSVSDKPLYSFRGLHIDVARNFHSKELILKIIEQMGAYKLNKLHLHLGDDEGWRLEVAGLPELTDISSKRCHDLTEAHCLLATLGSGPHSNSDINGYYTIEDYKDLLRAASARNIQIIPSFDMPGHSRAAIKAMEVRYHKFMAQGEEEKAKEYFLTDLNDKTVYQSIQSYDDNTLNVCMESTYRFINKVIDGMKTVHAAAGQPLTRYHLGADETAGAWTESPVCKEFLADNEYGVETIEELNSYFVERVVKMLAAKDIIVAGWHDGMGKVDPNSIPKVQTNIWAPIYEGARELAHRQAAHEWLEKGAHGVAHEQANYGWDVVLSTPEALYFDFQYSADPKEHGQNWAMRELDTRKVFEFMPDNLPAHAEFWTNKLGQSYTIDDRVQRDEDGNITHRPRKRGNGFAGIQGQIWSETLRSDELVEYMLFPRMIALAERAWYKPEWAVPYNYDGAIYGPSTNAFTDQMQEQRDAEWNQFANAIARKVLPKLDRADIQYRIPPVGAQITDGILKANISLPGLAIEFRVDEGDWHLYQGPVEVNGEMVEVRAIAPDGRRRGRSLHVI